MNTSTARTTLSFGEAFAVAAICFGLSVVASVEAVAVGFPDQVFSDASNVWAAFIELMLAMAAVFYLRVRDFDVHSLIPRPDLSGVVVGIVLYLVTEIACTAVLAVLGLESAVVGFSFTGASLGSTVLISIVNGTFEEVFLLGVLTRGLREQGASIAIGLSLLVRLLTHLYQGPAGAVSILVFGLVLSVFYVRTGRLWPVVFAHILADVVPMTLGGAGG
ncbi:CPBP family intramembrane metalloprotease [Lysobacter sp. LF1]|uniref:CPBP family intramembrane metalloprotease n=1 Tax=Lysobacter stagni TaxID=3045172 RepID=A0ABT6XBN9_9GAMM|nr:CPBP family intramembrane glutamic endopeptidase [Lysobacter sp. LF1]MDI9237562.1 CPBP family intramembrane metalloprotease [Lysobacter sp. LF1]